MTAAAQIRETAEYDLWLRLLPVLRAVAERYEREDGLRLIGDQRRFEELLRDVALVDDAGRPADFALVSRVVIDLIEWWYGRLRFPGENKAVEPRVVAIMAWYHFIHAQGSIPDGLSALLRDARKRSIRHKVDHPRTYRDYLNIDLPGRRVHIGAWQAIPDILRNLESRLAQHGVRVASPPSLHFESGQLEQSVQQFLNEVTRGPESPNIDAELELCADGRAVLNLVSELCGVVNWEGRQGYVKGVRLISDSNRIDVAVERKPNATCVVIRRSARTRSLPGVGQRSYAAVLVHDSGRAGAFRFDDADRGRALPSAMTEAEEEEVVEDLARAQVVNLGEFRQDPADLSLFDRLMLGMQLR